MTLTFHYMFFMFFLLILGKATSLPCGAGSKYLGLHFHSRCAISYVIQPIGAKAGAFGRLFSGAVPYCSVARSLTYSAFVTCCFGTGLGTGTCHAAWLGDSGHAESLCCCC